MPWIGRNKQMKSLRITATALIFFTALSGCSSSTTGGSNQLVQLVVSNTTGLVSEPYVLWGIEKGYFAEAGLEVTSTPGSSPTDSVAGLVGGAIDVSSIDVVNLLAGTGSGGLDPVIVASLYGIPAEDIELALTEPDFDGQLVLETGLMIRPGLEFEDFQALSKPVIARRSALSAASLGAEAYLDQEGFDLPSVEWKTLTSANDRLLGLLNADVDAALLAGAHAYEAIDNGATLVAYPNAYWMPAGPLMVWVSSRDRVEADASSLERFQKVMYQVARDINDPANADQFRLFLKEKFDLSDEALSQVKTPVLSEMSDTPADFGPVIQQAYGSGITEQEVQFDEKSFLEYFVAD